MLYKTYVPREPLSSLVDFFWFFSGVNPPGTKELNLPEGMANLITNLREDNIRIYDRHNKDNIFGPSVICGPQSDYFVMENSNERLMIGVQFRPGRASALLRASSYEAVDSIIGLDDLWGAGAADLRDELLYASTVAERFHILENHMLARIDCSRRPNSAIEFALLEYRKAPLFQSIRDTMEQTNLSPKRFTRMFKEEVGMTPKRFSRLMRFQKAVHLIRQTKQTDWLNIALTCGYYDQAHFIKEFRAFSGLTPTEYRLKKSNHPSHVPMM